MNVYKIHKKLYYKNAQDKAGFKQIIKQFKVLIFKLFHIKIFLFFILVFLTGCMKIGQDYQKPDITFKIPATYNNANKSATKAPAFSKKWWQVFKNHEIDRLVDLAIKNNLDIKKAVARILEVTAQFTQAKSEKYPKINFETGWKRQSNSILNPLTGKTQNSTTTTYTMSIPAKFELDLFGHIARSKEASYAELLREKENCETIALSIVSETITFYLQTKFIERKIQITKNEIDNYKKNLDLVTKRYNRGLTSSLDIRQTRTKLAQAKSEIPSLIHELGTCQQKISILTGQYPETNTPKKQAENYFKHLEPVPSGLPSDLLKKRPDIRKAEANLIALNARIGMAKANRFPKIVLTGAYGFSSRELGDLVKTNNKFWTLASGLLSPIFNAPKLKYAHEAAKAHYINAIADYSKIILTAFFEVENALLKRKQELKKRDRIINLLNEADATYKTALHKYKNGLVNYSTLLQTQQTLFNAQKQLTFSDFTILSNRVSLHRALGGGWSK